jgi:O-antigen ligase
VEGVKLLAALCVYFLVLNHFNSKRRIDLLLHVLLFVGAFEAFYAIYQSIQHTPTVWWWASRAGEQRYSSGTFMGSNHFATYMVMLLSLTLGFIVAQKMPSKRMLPGLGGFRAALHRIVDWFSPESTRPKTLFLLGVSILIGAGLVLSVSRGAFLGFFAALLAGSAALFSKRAYRRYGVLLFLVFLFAAVLGLFVRVDLPLRKIDNLKDSIQRRMLVNEMIPAMVAEYPLTGSGWGNFRFVYQRFNPPDWDEVGSSGHAHNEWLETFADTGFIGFSFLLGAVFFYFYRMFRLWRKRRDAYAVGIGLGVMMALVAAGVHCLLDFSMRYPANAFTLAALAALGYVVIHRRGHQFKESFFYQQRKIRLTPLRKLGVLVCVLLFCGLGGGFSISHFRAEAKCPTETNQTMRLNWHPYPSEIQKAIRINPLNPQYHVKLATHYKMQNVKDVKIRREMIERAVNHMEQAVSLNPATGGYWWILGKSYQDKRYDVEGYISRWLPLADDCYDAALSWMPNNTSLLSYTGWYWVWRSKILSSDGETPPKSRLSTGMTREEGIRKFQHLFQRLFSITTYNWKKFVDVVWREYQDETVVLGMIPPEKKELASRVLEYLTMKNEQPASFNRKAP